MPPRRPIFSAPMFGWDEIRQQLKEEAHDEKKDKALSKLLSKFRTGEEVMYIPKQAKGPYEDGCEIGIVTSVGSRYVFVRYGDEKQSKATDPVRLMHMKDVNRKMKFINIETMDEA